jgi:hypothetical protein
MPATPPSRAALPASVPSLLHKWCDLWGANSLPTEISVEISARMTRSLGRCYPDRNLIRIAWFVTDESEALFQEVLCHEAAHLAAYHLHGRSIRPHGHEWQVLMQQAGYAPAVRFKESRLTRRPPPRTRRRKSVRVPRAVRRRWIDSILDKLQVSILKNAGSSAYRRRKI